jgi:hypothetical protein
MFKKSLINLFLAHCRLPGPPTMGLSPFNPDQGPTLEFAHSNDQPVLPSCPHCREPMKLVHTIPRLGGLPEIFVFYCARCKHAETEMLERAA